MLLQTFICCKLRQGTAPVELSGPERDVWSDWAGGAQLQLLSVLQLGRGGRQLARCAGRGPRAEPRHGRGLRAARGHQVSWAVTTF